MDFAVLVDYRVKMKENEKIDKHFTLPVSWKKKKGEYEDEGDINFS